MEKLFDIASNSYMEMSLHLDGEDVVILRIPTVWDEPDKQWIGAIKTPLTKKLICASGKDSFELQNNFNIELKKYFQDERYSQEIFSMFKPKKFWENLN